MILPFCFWALPWFLSAVSFARHRFGLCGLGFDRFRVSAVTGFNYSIEGCGVCVIRRLNGSELFALAVYDDVSFHDVNLLYLVFGVFLVSIYIISYLYKYVKSFCKSFLSLYTCTKYDS